MFSQAAKYAIRAVLCLAIDKSIDNKARVKEIAKRLDIPAPFLAKILQELAKNKLISSSKGPKGGFYLTEENLNRPLINIIELYDGLALFDKCVLGLNECSSQNPCPVHKEVSTFKLEMYNLLGHQSIKDIAKRVKNGEATLWNKIS